MNFLQMMGLLVTCPPAAEISDIPNADCPEDVGQVQKLIFQRQFSATGVRNTVTPANAALKATWDGLLAAADNTKVQVTPFIMNPETEPGTAITDGDGNAVVGGVPIVTGREQTRFSYEFVQVKQSVIKALKQLEGETLGVWLIDEFGRIWGDSDDGASPTQLYPIPLRSVFFGDKSLGGLEVADRNFCEFSMVPNWSDDIASATPSDFDALTDLANP